MPFGLNLEPLGRLLDASWAQLGAVGGQLEEPSGLHVALGGQSEGPR